MTMFKIKIVIVMLFLTLHVHGLNTPGIPSVLPTSNSTPAVIDLNDIKNLKIRGLQKKLGRKFRFKEKVALLVLKKQLNKKTVMFKNGEADPDKQGLISFIAGSSALVILGLGLLNIITGSIFFILIPLVALVAFWLGMRSRRSGKNFRNTFGYIIGGFILMAGIVAAALLLIFGVF